METIENAISLRKDGSLEESNAMLLSLLSSDQYNATLNFQVAWSYDALGREAEAVPYYVESLRLGLSEEEELDAIIGLGSTYRTLGLYEDSKDLLQRGLSCFPENHAMKTFYAMTLYNLGFHREAMEVLLTCIANTSEDPYVNAYRKAIVYYADKLDQIWG